jgi:hypothetical protein
LTSISISIIIKPLIVEYVNYVGGGIALKMVTGSSSSLTKPRGCNLAVEIPKQAK